MTRLWILFACLAFSSTASALNASDYWPTSANDKWTFEYRDAATGAALSTEDVRVTRRIGGWARIEGFLQADHWLWMSSQDGTVYSYSSAQGVSTAMELKGPSGATFTSSFPSAPFMDGGVFEVTNSSAQVTTPVGTFQDCLVLENTLPAGMGPGFLREIVFAPGVGPIQFTPYVHHGAPQVAVLVSADVGGTSYRPPTTVGTSVCLEVDAVQFTHPSMMVPASMTVSLKVRSSQAVGLDFGTSQEYEIELVDLNTGLVVRRWSDGRNFQASPHLSVLSSSTYTEVLQLTNTQGQFLAPGAYGVRMWLTNSPPHLTLSAVLGPRYLGTTTIFVN